MGPKMPSSAAGCESSTSMPERRQRRARALYRSHALRVDAHPRHHVARQQPDPQRARLDREFLHVRPAGAGAVTVSPRSGPAIASSAPARSRTVRASAISAHTRAVSRCSAGVVCGTRPREGFNVATPQHAAGLRSEPVPSAPCAIDVMPAATAAADPPLDPPARAIDVPRVVRRAERSRLRRHGRRQLRHVRLSQEDEARPLEAPRQLRSALRAIADVTQHPRAEVVRRPLHLNPPVLHQHRHARERPVAVIAVPRLPPRLIEQRRDDSVDARVQRIDARDRGVDQLERAYLARAYERRLLGRVELPEGIVRHHSHRRQRRLRAGRCEWTISRADDCRRIARCRPTGRRPRCALRNGRRCSG